MKVKDDCLGCKAMADTLRVAAAEVTMLRNCLICWLIGHGWHCHYCGKLGKQYCHDLGKSSFCDLCGMRGAKPGTPQIRGSHADEV